MVLTAYPQSKLIDIIQSDLGQPTGIAPAFFGPNAFPVPEMSDGKIADDFTVDVAGDVFSGFIVPGAKDMTYDLFLNLRMPLFSDRVGLNIWMATYEWYSMDKAVMDARRIAVDEGTNSGSGDVYISLEIALAKEKKIMPAILLRSVLKTASGNSFGMARFFDCAGYFFDVTAAKSFLTRDSGFFRGLRTGVSGGFLCWQTDVGRQNDAIQYGVFARVLTEAFTLNTQFSGYVGWENYGDRPMTLSVKATACPDWSVQPFFQYQRGLNDWPFNQYRFGVSVNASALYRKAAKK